jgi:hypothetical protein
MGASGHMNIAPRFRILHPYTPRVNDLQHRLQKLLVVAAVIFLAFFLGLVVAVLPIQLLVIPLVPIVLLALFVLWAAPDIDPELDRPIRLLFIATIFFSVCWPHYVAFRAPGIGFITPARLVLYTLALIFLFAVATSKRLRTVIANALATTPVTKWAFIGLFTLQLLLAFGWLQFPSRWINAQVFWYLMFPIAIVAAAYQGVPRLFAIVMLVSVPLMGGFTYWEYASGYKVWMPWVPEFLRGDPVLWNNVLTGASRAGTDQYRASGILLTSVTVGEYVGLVWPFVLYTGLRWMRGWRRVLALGLAAFIVLALIAAGARTGFVTVIVSTGILTLLWALRRWKTHKGRRDLLGAAAVWGYPIGGVVVILAVLFVGRIRRLVLGGGEHKNSNLARDIQWDRTWSELAKNPFGSGPNTSAERIQYRNDAGVTTVDGYYMNLLMDYGVLGTLCFIVFFASAAWYAGRTYIGSTSTDEEIAGPIAAAIVAFLFSKYGLSQEELHHIVFAMAGIAVALTWRQSQQLKTVPRPPATISRPVRPQRLPPIPGRPRPA